MFIYLIKECKVKVYDVRTKNSIRRVEKKYILSIIIWIVFGMLFTLALGLQWDNIIKAVIGVVLTVDMVQVDYCLEPIPENVKRYEELYKIYTELYEDLAVRVFPAIKKYQDRCFEG